MGAADGPRHRWRTVALKEESSNYTYGLYASTGTSRPSGNAVTGGTDHDLRGPATLALNTGCISPRRTTAPTSGCTSTEPLSPPRRRRARSRSRPARSASAATRFGRVLPGPDRRGPGLQPRADPGRGPGGHGTARATDTRNPTVTAVTPAARATNVVDRRRSRPPLQRGDGPGDDHDAHVRAPRRRRTLVPASVTYDPLDGAGNADADDRAPLRDDVHGRLRERRDAASRTSPAGHSRPTTSGRSRPSRRRRRSR